MKLGIFVWLVLALLAAGVAARTHSRASHSASVKLTDPGFFRLNKTSDSSILTDPAFLGLNKTSASATPTDPAFLRLDNTIASVTLTDPAFLRVDKKIRETFPNLIIIRPLSAIRTSTGFPTVWTVSYLTDGSEKHGFVAYENPEGVYQISKRWAHQ